MPPTAPAAIIGIMVVHLKWDPKSLPDEVREKLPRELAELPAGDYRVEDVEMLDEEESAAIAEGLRQIEAGDYVTHSEVKRRLGL